MKTIFITGANEGIGYHMVRQFLEEEKNVTVLDLNIGQLESLSNRYPGKLLVIKGDAGNTECVETAVQSAKQKFGKIDYAIHNACLCPFDDFETMRYDDYYNTFAVNYYGAVNLCRAVLPVMKEQNSGKVFFTSSIVGVIGFPGISAYASTKSAIESFAKCMNLEYQGSGISFHIFHPPLTKTRSAEPLPVPDQFKENAEVVGRGLAKRIEKNSFIICHNRSSLFQIRMMYLFPVKAGIFLNNGAKKFMASR